MGSTSAGYKYDIYTLKGNGEGVGLTDGLVASDGVNSATRLDSEKANRRLEREAAFPLDLLQKALSVSVGAAESSVDTDRTRLLNALTGATGPGLESAPDTKGPSIDAADGVIRARLASVGLFAAFGAGKEKPLLEALRKGSLLELSLNFDGHRSFDDAAAKRLAQAMPSGLVRLHLSLNRRGDAFLAAVDFSRFDQLHTLTFVANGVCLPDNKVDGLGALCAAFRDMKMLELRCLDLSDNHVGEVPMGKLCESVQNRSNWGLDIKVGGVDMAPWQNSNFGN